MTRQRTNLGPLVGTLHRTVASLLGSGGLAVRISQLHYDFGFWPLTPGFRLGLGMAKAQIARSISLFFSNILALFVNLPTAHRSPLAT